jgi:hypothetical protein
MDKIQLLPTRDLLAYGTVPQPLRYRMPPSYKGMGRKGKATLVTGRADPRDYETSRLPHSLHNRLIHGAEVRSRAPSYPRNIPGTRFC